MLANLEDIEGDMLEYYTLALLMMRKRMPTEIASPKRGALTTLAAGCRELVSIREKYPELTDEEALARYQLLFGRSTGN